jgi:hypothetical protein|tara:strand:- start:455 stop:760 length:306 start_codon:yes stop_codon:yes gene_type:complete
MALELIKINGEKNIEGKVNKNLQIIYLTKIINNMIKRTEISQQKTPTVTKNKARYSNKGLAPLKTDAGTFDANTTPKPGMGKGKARGMGAAEYGGKFSGIY